MPQRVVWHWTLLLAALACSAVAAAPAALQIAPLDYAERRLANGLQVLSVSLPASATVSVQVWYHVGSKDDPPGRSGFAHLFEHLMFKSTRHLANEQFDRLTEDVGGENNAFTGDDVTGFHSVVPAEQLETLLWAEAERMSNLNVDEASFRSERAVVEAEFRERILGTPYGRFFHAMAPAAYRQHPYRRPGIGRIEELEAATLDDVRAFHRHYYRPDNATLVVAGGFDPQQLSRWVDRYFGRIERPAAPVPRIEADEPPWTADRRVLSAGSRVPLPAVALIWLAPSLRHPDAAALRVVAALLSAGESSRLNQALVYRRQLASQAGFDADLRVGPGLLVAYAIGAGEQPLSALGAALNGAVRRLARRAPPLAELAKAKMLLLTRAVAARQTPAGQAGALADAATLGGDAARVDTDLHALQRVSAGDVQRVARRYLAQARRVTLEYRQAAPGPLAERLP